MLIKGLLCAQHCSEHLICVNSAFFFLLVLTPATLSICSLSVSPHWNINALRESTWSVFIHSYTPRHLKVPGTTAGIQKMCVC